MTSYQDIIGRADVNDLDAILAITNTDATEAIHAVRDNADAIFTWDYERSRSALGRLYEKAKGSQWNGQTDLPWDVAVDQEKLAVEMGMANSPDLAVMQKAFDCTPVAKWEIGRAHV